MPKNFQTTTQQHSFHMLARLCSKSYKLGFSSMCTKNFQMYKLDSEMAEEPKIKRPTPTGSQKKQGNSRKTFTSASLTTLKPLTVWIPTNHKILTETECLAPEKPICRTRTTVSTRHGTTGWFQLGKECIKAVYCHPAYLTYVQKTTSEMLG